MRFVPVLLSCVVCSLTLHAPEARAESLMSLYRAAVLQFPSIESFRYREQALKSENAGLGWQRIIDLDMTSNLSHLRTRNLGEYTSGDIGVSNTFDIFDKKGLDRAINSYEMEKNRALSDSEKKYIFTRITEAYYAFLNSSRLLQIHRESLEWIDRNILQVHTGVDSGVFPASDISRWTIERLNCRNSIFSDSLVVTQASETLRILTGIPNPSPEESQTSETGDVVFDDLIAHSPELVAYDLEKKQTEMEIRKEFRDQFPDLEIGDSFVRDREPGGTGDQNVVGMNLNFKLFDSGRRFRISSLNMKIQSIEAERKAALADLTEYYRNQISELNTRRAIAKNLQEAGDLSANNLSNLVTGYQKRFVDFTSLFSAFRDDLSIRENRVSTTFEFDRSYQFLYHLSRGDIYF
jgi:outer membrane protein